MKGKVLILSNFLHGLYSFRKEVIKAIADEGYTVYISIPEIDSEIAASYFKEAGCTIISTPFNRRGVNPFEDFKLLRNYIKLIKQLSPKAVLTYTIKPNVYGGMACKWCNIPQFANVTGLGDAMENGGLMAWLTKTLYRIGLSKAKKVFFQNAANRNFFIRANIVNEENIVLLPGSGVNLNFHTYQEYPKDDGVLKFLYIGPTKKDKGMDELFEAATRIKEKHSSVEFDFLGNIENGYDERFNDLEKKGVFNFYSHSNDVRPFIGAVHCTIMPSYHEGMSNVNLESAANGRPVITTNVPGCKETVDDGISGILVETKNTESLFCGIERFINLPYNQKVQMGENARRKVEKEFDRQIIVKAYIRELNRMELKK